MRASLTIASFRNEIVRSGYTLIAFVLVKWGGGCFSTSFTTRDEAFDFKTALQHTHNQEREEAKAKAFMESAPSRDLSLQAGSSIKIKVPIKKKKEASASDDADDDDVGIQSAAAPPKLVALPKPAAAKKRTALVEPSASVPVAHAPDFSAPTAADDFEWCVVDKISLKKLSMSSLIHRSTLPLPTHILQVGLWLCVGRRYQ